VRLHRFFRTTTFRLALLYAVLFSASSLVLFAFIYGTTSVLIAREREESIAANMASLQDHYAATGLRGLAAAILARAQPNRVGDNIYLLTDPRFRPIAGNGTGWPPFVEQDGPWLTFPIERQLLGDPEVYLAKALHAVLPGGYHLLVGQDMRTQERFRRAIVEALIWSVAITLCLGLVVGLVMSRNTLRRIESINSAAERIMRGEFKHRIPGRARGRAGGDEFDRLAENLNAMLDEIDRLMGSMRTVTHNIAHDLRSPLTRVRNRLESALAGMDESDPRRETVEQAVAEADQLLATFNALLSIADAEAGAGRGDMVPLDLEAVARDVAELYEPLVEERGLSLETRLLGQALVPGNRQLLFQAIANLIDNAVKYAGPGRRISLAVEPGDGRPELVVADNGPGIPASDRARVLERFVRLDPSRSTPGSGLGLSLVAAIARLHNAALSLEDNHPGLKVRIRFPMPG
jgi:signal transduction histidine kinase